MRRVDRFAFAIWLLGLVISAWLVARAPFLTDMSAFMPQRPTPEQRLLTQNLTRGVAARLLLVGIDSVAPDQQAKLSNQLAQSLRESKQFRSVNNGSLDALAADQALLFARRYQLSPTVNAQQFEVPQLRLALQESIDLLSSSAGAFAGDLALRDPTGEMMRLLDRLGAGNTPQLNDGVWVTPDRKRVLLLLYSDADGGDLDGQQRAIQTVEQRFAQIRDSLQIPAANLYLSGPGRFAVASRDAIRADVTRLSTVGAGMILAILLIAFRSLAALALALVPIASAVLAGAAAVALSFGSIHALTMGFGTTLIGEAVDYALYHLVRSASSEPAPQSAFWRTIRLGVMTSMVGFAALLFTGFPGLAQMAVFSIAGLLVAALVTRWILPALTPTHFKAKSLVPLDRLAQAALLRLPRFRVLAVALLVAAAAVALARGDRLWDNDIASLNPVSRAAQQLHQDLQDALGAPAADLMLVVSSGSQAQTLRACDDLAKLLDGWVAAGKLAGFESPSTILVPPALQQARTDALPDEKTLRDRLQQAAQGLPLRVERLDGFVADVQAARLLKPLTRADLVQTQIGLRVESLLAGSDDDSAAIISLRPTTAGAIDVQQLRALLPKLPDAQISVLQLKEETDKLYGGYLREARALSMVGALAIVALLAASIRSWRGVLRVCTPLLGAVVLLIGGFALAGKAMNLLHLVGLLLVVAIGSNYALFLYSLRSGALSQTPSQGTLASLLLANLTTLAGFLVLSLSQVPLLSALGTTVGLGAALSLVLSAVWIGAAEPAAASSSSSSETHVCH